MTQNGRQDGSNYIYVIRQTIDQSSTNQPKTYLQSTRKENIYHIQKWSPSTVGYSGIHFFKIMRIYVLLQLLERTWSIVDQWYQYHSQLAKGKRVVRIVSQMCTEKSAKTANFLTIYMANPQIEDYWRTAQNRTEQDQMYTFQKQKHCDITLIMY